MITVLGRTRTSRNARPVAVTKSIAKRYSYRLFHASKRTDSDNSGALSVRWFYATDVPKSKPKYITDWKPTKPASKYTAFSARDSKRLEESHQTDASKPVLVQEGGLFSVNVDKRELYPTYWDGPVYDVRRGTWFFVNGQNLSPFPEDLAEEVERVYNEGPSEKVEDRATLDHRDYSELRYADDELFLVERPKKDGSENSTWRKYASVVGAGGSSDGEGNVLRVVRGYIHKDAKVKVAKQDISFGARLNALVDTEGKINSILFGAARPADSRISTQMEKDYDTGNEESQQVSDHLILCLHGIGQKLSQRIESVNFVHDINVFRKLAQDELSIKDGKKVSPSPAIQVLPIIWRHGVQLGGLDGSCSLNDITVRGITAFRNVVGDVVLDVLLYSDPVYREQILENVTTQLNTTVRKFTANNNGKLPRVSLIGHSLGSVIAYDILTTRSSKERPYGDSVPISKTELEFPIDNTFFLGSPLGIYELISRRKISPETVNSRSIFNVFHPSDPISYRFEPLIEPLAGKLDPEVVPYTKGGISSQIQEIGALGQKISTNASQLFSSISEFYNSKLGDDDVGLDKKEQTTEEAKGIQLSDAEVAKLKSSLSRFNQNGRVDYVLQEGVLEITLLTAIASHVGYFDNPDVVKFIMKYVTEG